MSGVGHRVRRALRHPQATLAMVSGVGLARLRRIVRGQPDLLEPRLMTWSNFHGAPPGDPQPTVIPLTSSLCRQAHFSLDVYRYWTRKICEEPRFHRKQWEFVYIAQALWERDFLAPGMRGVGFGVGKEPLAALFASFGCSIVATDLQARHAAEGGWVESHQNAASLEDLGDSRICPPELFRKRVSFRNVDMNAIPGDLRDFDFCWSACAFEHLGSLENGLRFVRSSLETLRPGGLAVHTTEFNLSSDDGTVESPHLCAYRRRDIQALIESLEKEGHEVAPLDLSPGQGLVDGYVDLPPYARPEPHLRLLLGQYACTSIGLIVRRGP